LAERLPKLLAALAVAFGLAVVGIGLSVFAEAWQTSRAWAGSAEAEHADLPAASPIWLDQPADDTSQVDLSTARPSVPVGTMTTLGVDRTDTATGMETGARHGYLNASPQSRNSRRRRVG